MSLLFPTTAPAVHIEPLHELTRAATAEIGHYDVDGYQEVQCLRITSWVSDPRAVTQGEPQGDLGSFRESTCEDCEFYCETIEVEPDNDIEYTIDGHNFTASVGEVTVESPCTCYDNGIDDVDWPCPAGYDEPDGNGEEVELSLNHMRYAITRNIASNEPWLRRIKTFASQQAIALGWDDTSTIEVTEERRAINCYDPSHRICWGRNPEPNNLRDVVVEFMSTPANADLLSYDGHQYNADQIKDADLNEDFFGSIDGIHLEGLRDERALVVATASHHASAFLNLIAQGCWAKGGVCAVDVYRYKQVMVRPDDPMDVWATDVLPTGQILLFLDTPGEDNGMLIGLFPPSILETEPCELTKSLSSAPEVRDNKCCPASSAC